MELMLGYEEIELEAVPTGWSLDCLGNLCATSSGTTPSRSAAERYYRNGTIYWVKTTDLTNSDISVTEELVTKTALDETSLRVYPVGTVLVAMYGGFNQIGRTGLLRVPAAVNQAITAIQTNPKSLVSEYLINVLNYRVSYWKTVASSSRKDPNITSYDIKKFPIIFPDKREQRAIATALSDVDALIASLDRLIAKKRDIKQATMQQLLTGKTRLPGFSGEWEVKKLEEIREKFVNGGTPSTQKSECWQGNIPWITGADVINQKISDIRRFITTEAVKNSSTNIIERGNLLLVTRTGVGKLAVASFDVAISQDITGIYVKKEQASIEYLFHYFNYSSEALKSLNQGTSIAGITRETLLSTRVYLPSLSEQRAIVTVLSDMDAEIAALEQKRDKTRALKQGMMQELLTGKTRLV